MGGQIGIFTIDADKKGIRYAEAFQSDVPLSCTSH